MAITRIGRMRKRISIMSRVDVEEGTYSCDEQMAVVDTVWAKVTNLTGVQQVDSLNAESAITHQMVIRYRTDVTKKNQIQYNGFNYTIVSVQEGSDERQRFLIIDANQMDVIGTLDNPSPEV